MAVSTRGMLSWGSYQLLEINAKDLYDYLVTTFTQKKDNYADATHTIPIMLWGKPGVGKSAIVRQAFEKAAFHLIGTEGGVFTADGEINGVEGELKFRRMFRDIRASTLEPTDLRGIPVPDWQRHNTVWLQPVFLPTENDTIDGTPNGPKLRIGVIFLDELNAAPVTVQIACYQLILDRRLGDYKLPDWCFVIAAGNPPEFISTKTVDMPPPLRNRMLHLTLEPHTDAWLEYAQTHGIHPIIISYISAYRDDALYSFNPSIEVNGATPRSWEFLSIAMKTYSKGFGDVSNLRALPEKIIYGLIGKQTPDFVLFRDSVVVLPTDVKHILEYKICIPQNANTSQIIQIFSKLPEYSGKKKKEELEDFITTIIKDYVARSKQATEQSAIATEEQAVQRFAINIHHAITTMIITRFVEYKTKGVVGEYGSDINAFVHDLFSYIIETYNKNPSMVEQIQRILIVARDVANDLHKKGNDELFRVFSKEIGDLKIKHPDVYNTFKHLFNMMVKPEKEGA